MGSRLPYGGFTATKRDLQRVKLRDQCCVAQRIMYMSFHKHFRELNMKPKDKNVSRDTKFFATREVVEILLRYFVPEEYAEKLEFATLECSTSEEDDKKPGDDVRSWRIGRKNANWIYLSLFELQEVPEPMYLTTVLFMSMRMLLDVASINERCGLGAPDIFPILVCNGDRSWKEHTVIPSMFGDQKALFVLDTYMISPEFPDEGRWIIGAPIHLENTSDIENTNKALDEDLQLLKFSPKENLILESIQGKLKLKEVRKHTKITIEDMHKFLTRYLACKKKFIVCNDKTVANSSFPEYNTVQKERFGKKYILYNDNHARIKEKCILQLLRQQKYQMEMQEGAQDFLFYILVNRFGLLPLPVATYITRTSIHSVVAL